MGFKPFGRLFAFLIVALSSLILYACAPDSQIKPAATPAGVYPVDPVFREFYRTLGGNEVLGPAISRLFAKERAQCQYTSNSLLCYNAEASELEHFSLYPLGRAFGLHDTPLVQPQAENTRMVDGFVIYDEFIPLYDRLRGARYVGHPITQVRINYTENRIEQYFENVGFYRRLDLPRGQVNLIAYGAASCENGCKFSPEAGSGIPSGEAGVDQPFADQILRIGGVPVFGQPLTASYTARDGAREQVYEKAVFYAPGGESQRLRLRPIPLILGISFTLPEEKIADRRMVFYPVGGRLGYNVPRIFDEFITLHGGKEISGQPISAIQPVANQPIYRQCFENYCLEYDPSASESLRVRLAPLGMQYVDQAGLGERVIQQFSFSADSIILTVSEKKPQVASSDPQQVYMVVVQRKDQRPVANVEGDLIVQFPDDRKYSAHFPPTNSEGVSTVTIPAQPDVPNGSVIAYQVCLNIPGDQQLCVQETYLIWNSK